MISLNLQVRRAAAHDHRQIASLIFHETNTHRHLDWRSALEWLGSQNYWVLDENGTITAALACPEDPPDVAWIRLFSHHSHLSGPEAWSALWETARADIFRSSLRTTVAAIVLKQWFQNLLVASNFELQQNIVLLQLKAGDAKLPPISNGFRIRPMLAADLPEVAQLDRMAFGAFWHNTLDSLQRAYSQSVHASVVEDDLGVVGYQISTGNPLGAHLARLGVRSEAQGRGVGSALVADLVRYLETHQAGNLSVNTQSDNAASLALYKKFGFIPTGEHFPVFVYRGAAGVA
ncbi:MAG: GNAT family N-acetyltransferase [Anaerolineaceae bacterium]|jgi:ribosomal protein S18 acetylase RimI-like enzyme|nr:MAG: GNAT family N-acetyltransferase [Anaerolineaceae bacterium]